MTASLPVPPPGARPAAQTAPARPESSPPPVVATTADRPPPRRYYVMRTGDGESDSPPRASSSAYGPPRTTIRDAATVTGTKPHRSPAPLRPKTRSHAISSPVHRRSMPRRTEASRAQTPYSGSTRAGGVRYDAAGAEPHGTVVVFTSPSGGIGTSTLTALTGLTLHGRDMECALFDADLDGGGLDVLLGIEHEPGLTLQDLDAPLGHIEGEALNHELPQWDGIHVLAHTPWRGGRPDWWELEAAAEALADANDVVLVDAGRGGAIPHVPPFAKARQVMVVDLTVLGMARAKAHLEWLHGATDGAGVGGEPPVIVGVEPRGAPRHRTASSMALTEAIAYLGEDVIGPLRVTPSLCADMLEGLGIRSVPKHNRRAVGALADEIRATGGRRPAAGEEPTTRGRRRSA
ncbi:hypothetical protein [Bifidobacterium aesculapii]|uniref:hypothetical protein n=1 Tax=Bifidobacterium aesculapii TaxID=1329411 RepID=UPI001F2D9EBD|nr:hypothetical protein [Bifidobacterium aesculapii]